MWKDRAWSFVTGNNFFLIALIGVVGIAYLRFAPDSLKPWSNAPQVAQQARESKVVERIERVIIPGPERVVTIEKVKYVEKLPEVITPATIADNSAHVIASATIPPSPAGGTASAILRVGPDGVGSGTIEYRPATPPFFAVQKEFGIRAGMGTGGLIIGEVYARPARVGPITVEIRAFGMRTDRSGADFGAAVLGDYRF